MAQRAVRGVLEQPGVYGDHRLRIDLEACLFAISLLLTLLVRTWLARFNTAFVDEANYILIGRDALAHGDQSHVLDWLSGSLLHPAIAAIADGIAGLEGARGWSSIMSTLAVGAAGLVAWRLFSRQAGLWTVLLAGLSAGSISIGQFATQDATTLALLSVAGALIVFAATTENARLWWRLVLAGACVAVAVLIKYVALLMLPALVLLGVGLFLQRSRSLLPLLVGFVAPVLAVTLVYGGTYYNELVRLVTGPAAVDRQARGDIARQIFFELGHVLALAIGGIVLLTRRSTRTRVTLVFALAIIAGTAIPVYQLITGNERSLWKHTVFALTWLAPLGGLLISSVVTNVRAVTHGRAYWMRFVVAGLSAVVAILFVRTMLNENAGWHRSWPNASTAATTLAQIDPTFRAPMLIEGGPSYAYTLNLSNAERTTWGDTWYAEYSSLRGTEAMVAAIQDRYYTAVLLNDYYTANINSQLRAALVAAGYTIVLQETQQLRDGPLTTVIYRAPSR